jgi:NAD(P)-dependent dehydrogenase (short-subunit alcohol dehydrogenase family)
LESIELDLNKSDSIEAAVKTVLNRTGGTLDALFNNGAYGQPGAVEDLSRAALREQFETNLFGTQELTNHVLTVMRRQGQGRIIQNSSVLGFIAMPYRGAYTASKFALEALSDTMRMELAGTEIYVSLVEPGPITSRFRENAHAAFRRHIQADNSAHRETYEKVAQRLANSESRPKFNLPPGAVLKRVVHALESPKPRIRYYVTFPTYLFAVLRRILPFPVLDWMLKQASGNGSN